MTRKADARSASSCSSPIGAGVAVAAASATDWSVTGSVAGDVGAGDVGAGLGVVGAALGAGVPVGAGTGSPVTVRRRAGEPSSPGAATHRKDSPFSQAWNTDTSTSPARSVVADTVVGTRIASVVVPPSSSHVATPSSTSVDHPSTSSGQISMPSGHCTAISTVGETTSPSTGMPPSVPQPWGRISSASTVSPGRSSSGRRAGWAAAIAAGSSVAAATRATMGARARSGRMVAPGTGRRARVPRQGREGIRRREVGVWGRCGAGWGRAFVAGSQGIGRDRGGALSRGSPPRRS